MKNFRLIALIAAMMAVLPGAFSQEKPDGAKARTGPNQEKKKPEKITFLSGTKADFISKMRTTYKPGFMYLYVDNNARCGTFENRVLSDTSIVYMVDTTMLAFKLNAADYPYEATSLGIEDIPCLVLYDKGGHQVARLDGYHDVDKVKEFLKKVVE